MARTKKTAEKIERYPIKTEQPPEAFRYGLKTPTGVWVADSKGVWRFGSQAEAEKRLAQGDMPPGTIVAPLP